MRYWRPQDRYATRWWQLCVARCLIDNIKSSLTKLRGSWCNTNNTCCSAYTCECRKGRCVIFVKGFVLFLRFRESVPFKLSGKVSPWQCRPVSSCLEWTLTLGKLPGSSPVKKKKKEVISFILLFFCEVVLTKHSLTTRDGFLTQISWFDSHSQTCNSSRLPTRFDTIQNRLFWIYITGTVHAKFSQGKKKSLN